jgi:hypothetical protein
MYMHGRILIYFTHRIPVHYSKQQEVCSPVYCTMYMEGWGWGLFKQEEAVPSAVDGYR